MRSIGAALQPVLGATSFLLSPVKPAVQGTRPPLKDAVQPHPATTRAELEACINKLHSKRDSWAGMTFEGKAALLRACLDTTLDVAEEAAIVATNVKGSYSNGIGEEHLAWVPLVSGLREYAESLEAHGKPPVTQRTLTSGQVVMDVFPNGLEAALYGGWTGEVWIEEGKAATQGTLASGGSVALVLGAGNQASVPPLDILHKLVVEGAVVICKMNPINEYIGPFLRRALAPLVDEGFVEIVYGGGAEGAFISEHPLVSSVLLTGSAATFDTIVWGKDGKKTGKKALEKPVTGELGCFSPYIITPGGHWTEADLEYQAAQVATGLIHNASHNCSAAEVVVTAAEWPQRQEFLTALRQKLKEAQPRAAYYPGSSAKLSSFLSTFPKAEALGECTQEASVPWYLVTGLTPSEARVDRENWCGVLQEVALPGADLAQPAAFLPAAVAFANDKCYGNLSCSLLVHPEAEAANKDAVSAAIADLKYGCVAVNVVTHMGFSITKMPWGAFPGNPIEDIQSGNCMTHNTMMVDHPQKGVLRAPWIFKPAPFWSPFSRSGDKVAPHALRMMAFPNVINMMPLTVAALLG